MKAIDEVLKEKNDELEENMFLEYFKYRTNNPNSTKEDIKKILAELK